MLTDTDVLIVGGGLSGSLVARLLAAADIDFHLIEARDRLGGRILSPGISGDNPESAAVDLGPSWFWPHQRSLIRLIQSLGLEQSVYEQSHAGNSIIEYANGQLDVRAGAASMAGSYRLDGGMQTLIDRITASITASAISLNTTLIDIDIGNTYVNATVESPTGTKSINCQTIVVAVPPRLFAATVTWTTGDPSQQEALASVATWMATEAKIILIYDNPFWLDTGLSGDAMSQIGPMAEIHDATPRNSRSGVLFGFLMARPEQRTNQRRVLEQQATEQVQRLFDTEATPSRILYKDWSSDEFTATGTDRRGHRAHPSATGLRQADFGQHIIWSVSEMAEQDAGYLEGAVQAAHAAIHQLTRK